MKSILLKEWQYGTVDSIEDSSIPDTAASRSLNWVTTATKIELRRGYALFGTTEHTETSKVTGLITALKIGLSSTTEIPFRKRGRKLEYYDITTDDWIEVGTDIFPVGALTEHVSFTNYSSITGAQLLINSPNSSGLIKIITANPNNYIDLYDNTKNFRGYILAKQNRLFLWDRGGTTKDRTGLYGSYIDKDEATDFTAVTSESIGASGSTTYSGTLAFKAGGAKRSCFEVTFTDGNTTFTDNFDGTLTGSVSGASGTINYVTGEYSITFAAPSVGSVTSSYRYEDPTSAGVADFTHSSPRTAGQGFIFRQDDGGGIFRNIMAISGVEYCLHDAKTWALTLSADDTAATNLIYRHRVGIPFLRAAVETGDGVYYLDDTDKNDPHLRLLSFDLGGSEVTPKSVSKKLKIKNERAGKSLVGYTFDEAVVFEWGDYILLSCKKNPSTVNNRVFVYNKQTGAIDETDYYASAFAIYGGTLLAGDSVTGNVYTLFSGHDDNESLIDNYWEGSLNDFGMSRLKKQRKIVVQGEIGSEQIIKCYAAIDRGEFTLIGAIEGTGSYVDKTNRVSVGSRTIGSGLIGGSNDEIVAYNYMREFSFNKDVFQNVKLKFVAKGIGYASISTVEMKDIREKWHKIPQKYR